MTDVFETTSPTETHALGKRLAGRLRVGDCVALIGGLGAGKTVFVRGLAEGLGCDGQLVSSPTYVLVQEYPSTSGVNLYHLDLYRMTDPQRELADLGLEEMLADGAAVIEWADRAHDALPRTHMRITIEIDGPTHRRFVLERAATSSCADSG